MLHKTVLVCLCEFHGITHITLIWSWEYRSKRKSFRSVIKKRWITEFCKAYPIKYKQ